MTAITYSIGEKVEVKGLDSWLPATVFSSNDESGTNLMIQYSNIDDPSVDSVCVTTVRPAPPQAKRAIFQIGNFVQVFEGSNGWRSGKLIGFCEDSRCAVVFRGEEKATSVAFRDMRHCLHWINASWISHSADKVILQTEKKMKVVPLQTVMDKPQKRKPIDQENPQKRKRIDQENPQKRKYIDQEKPKKRKYIDQETEILKKKMKIVPLQTVDKANSVLTENHNRNPLRRIDCSKFKVGSEVEVRSDDDGYEGARFTATVIASLGQKRYRVKYHTIKTDDWKHFLEEEVKEEDIRPYPPKSCGISRYKKGEAVDLWHNEGWWEGVISRIVDESTYTVYFETTDEKMTCRRSRLRPHRD